MSLMERGGVKSSYAPESEKDLGWKGSAERKGMPKGLVLVKMPRPPKGFPLMSSQGGSCSGEMGLEGDASGPRMGSELAKT